MLKYVIVACAFLAPCSSFADPSTYTGNWDGFQLGIQGGYGLMSGSDSFGGERTLNSGILGVFAGYRYSFDHIVIGLAADVNASNFTSSTGASRSSGKWNAAGTVRIGYDVNRVLPYLSAGIGFAGYEVKRFQDDQTIRNTHVGVVFGAGLEAKILDSVTARIDYKHFEMSDEKYQFDGFLPFEIEGRQDLFALGVAYNF